MGIPVNPTTLNEMPPRMAAAIRAQQLQVGRVFPVTTTYESGPYEVEEWDQGGKPSKYKNKKTEVDGIIFDSKHEAEHYIILKTREKANDLWNLERQVPFEIIPSFTINGKKIRATYYIADFVYSDHTGKHVVDAKGYRTDLFILKKKMFEYQNNIEVEEV